MTSNQPDPVMGVVNPNMSFFQKHTRLQSLAGNRAPLNSIAITPFLQTLFTIPTVVSPSPQTAGLVFDAEEKIDTDSPVESSPTTSPSSISSDTPNTADAESKVTEADAVESNGTPIQQEPSKQSIVAAPQYAPAPALVPNCAWIDESLNAPVSPKSILALPNRLTGDAPEVEEDPVSVTERDSATPAVVAASEPASPTVELPSVDSTWMDSDLVAPVTPASILALPEKIHVAAIENPEEYAADVEEKDNETAAIPSIITTDAPAPVQTSSISEPAAAQTPLVPTALIPDNTWMDESVDAPVTPYLLLTLPEKNTTVVYSSAPIPPPSEPVEVLQVPAPPAPWTRISNAWTDLSIDAPVTPFALLALPEKNCTSAASPVTEPPLIASI